MKTYFLLAFAMMSLAARAQQDLQQLQEMEKLMKDFRPDTSAVPEDKLTAEIRELRKIRGAFNINTVIAYKIAEERNKKDMPAAQVDKLDKFFSDGNGKKWLENAVIWIYRKQYTYDEVKQIREFYQTPAGQKMASAFPIIIFESMKAAEMIGESARNAKPGTKKH